MANMTPFNFESKNINITEQKYHKKKLNDGLGIDVAGLPFFSQ